MARTEEQLVTLIAQLKDPEIHFPGNFDTAKRANALLMCLCQEAADALSASAPSGQKPVVLPFAIFDQEIADLRRFHECAMDDEGYDVPKDRMKRLAEIGLVRRASGNYYEHTDFGLAALNGDFDTAPQPDYKAQRDVERLDFLEKLVIESRTGVSVDFVRFVEDGLVTEKGFRLATFHNLRSRQPSLREAIDAAIASVQEGGAK